MNDISVYLGAVKLNEDGKKLNGRWVGDFIKHPDLDDYRPYVVGHEEEVGI